MGDWTQFLGLGIAVFIGLVVLRWVYFTIKNKLK